MQIIDMLILAAGVYLIALFTWVLYIAIMGLKANRHRLHWFAKMNAYAFVLPVGLLFDAILNLLVCAAFLRVPRDWLLTGTLKRVINTDSGIRERVAAWQCTHMLDQFDPKNDHC